MSTATGSVHREVPATALANERHDSTRVDTRNLRAGLAGTHDRLTDVGLLLLRLLPLVMFFHGLHKAQGYAGFAKTVAANPIGAAAPDVFAFMVVAGQLVLPVLVAIGLMTRLTAGLEGLMMLFIWGFMFAIKGLVDAKTGGPAGESALAYVFMMVPLVFTGAGRYSLDHWWSHRKEAAR
ncbi:DoxX family protein [Mariniluteicoccus flavus]